MNGDILSCVRKVFGQSCVLIIVQILVCSDVMFFCFCFMRVGIVCGGSEREMAGCDSRLCVPDELINKAKET